MNEGVAFATQRFQYRIPHCPIGRRPVMIGRRKPSYNTIDRVMTRLNRIMNVLEAMILLSLMYNERVIKRNSWYISVSYCFLFIRVAIKRPRWDRPPCLLLGCLQWRFCPVRWKGVSVPRSCRHRVDSVVEWDSTDTTVPYPNQTHTGVSIRVEPWPQSIPSAQRMLA